MIKSNPFTPQSGWEPRVFGGREEAISLFGSNLESAVSIRPNHLVILGEWGIGKTSLLKQFKRISQSKGNPACFCAISKFTKRDRPLEAVYLIAEEMLMGFPGADIDSEGLLKLFSRHKSLSQAQTQFTRFLLELWRKLDAKLAIVLLDDLQNLLPISNTIDILRAVLSKEEIVRNTRFLFVLSSTPSSWSMFIDKHDPVGRFFRKRLVVENLTNEEVKTTVEKTLKDTGVVFDADIKEKIYNYTGGHPYEVQLLSSHLYDSQIEGMVDASAWDAALLNTLKELGKDYFTSLLAKASDRERDLLKILAEEKKPLSITDFRNMMIVGRRARKFPIANIKNFLYRLEEKGIIARNISGNFDIPDRMFREFILKFS
ncbi:MAG: AAA family ATPase [Candidatus Omnitrophica bacterium]|nr:AAA family ATPase [Candidatus Omnitrophota bacterium]MBU4148749.1 AAA family ATPase [Candidatus Omnitrophota bacterium]